MRLLRPARSGDEESDALVGAGVDELVLVESPPEDPGEAAEWVAGLARRWMPAVG